MDQQWPTVTVITPTIGKKTLAKAVESVAVQEYDGELTHLIVTDGFDHQYNVQTCLLDSLTKEAYPEYEYRNVMLPYSTGADGHYGHRIYAGFSHLVTTDIVFFLDEDNWYDRFHVVTLVNLIKEKNLDWAYALRMIADVDGSIKTGDNCESLGRWDIWCQPGQNLVDTSSYAFTRPFLEKVGHLWHNKWGGDRIFYQFVTKQLKHTNYDTTGLHTLMYRLDGNPNSVTLDFFVKGNEMMEQKYQGNVFPWHVNAKTNLLKVRPEMKPNA